MKMFKQFKTGDNVIQWTGENGVVGIVPVFNSLSAMNRKYPGEAFLQIDID